MEIIIAKTAGFCFGVKRAVDMAFAETGSAETYTYGPIIHNEVVTGQLADKGIHIAEGLENTTAKKLIIRSHGVSPDVYEVSESKGIEIVDATCPYVTKIHRLVSKYSEAGYHVLIVGNKEHPEIMGISGWVKGAYTVIKDVEELKGLALKEGPYFIVAQTTYKKEVLEAVIHYLEEQGVKFEYKNTICNATKERQEEAAQIADTVDCMLVLGSQKSSNTLKLYEISKKHCTRSFCIAEAKELTAEMLEGASRIGITAGASTPHLVIDAVIEKLSVLSE